MVSKVFQFFVYALLRPLFLLYFRSRTSGEPPAGPVVLASNHPGRLDAFLLVLSLSLREYRALAPLRFVTDERYMYRWLPMRLIGCVSTRDSAHRAGAQALRAGHSVLIFPHGVLDDEGTVRVGAAWMGVHAHVPVVPVRITYSSGPLSVCRVCFGEPVRYEQGTDLQVCSHELSRSIRALC